MFSLRCLACLSPFVLSHFSPFTSSTSRCVSPTLSSSQTSSAALLTARQTQRLPLTLRMVDPASIRIHHNLFHHVMCLLDIVVFVRLGFCFLPLPVLPYVKTWEDDFRIKSFPSYVGLLRRSISSSLYLKKSGRTMIAFWRSQIYHTRNARTNIYFFYIYRYMI